MWTRPARAIVTALFLSAGFAATANSAVYPPSQQLSISIIDGFKGDPGQLLKQYPLGGAQLSSRVRDLAASDPSTLPMLIELLKTADPKTQTPSIAAGLAQVARMAGRAGQQSYGNDIQAAIATSGNDVAIAAYTANTGDVAIGATGGGGGGGGSGTGGSTGAGPVGGGTGGNASFFGASNYPNLRSDNPTGSVSSLSQVTSQQ